MTIGHTYMLVHDHCSHSVEIANMKACVPVLWVLILSSHMLCTLYV